MSYKKLGKRIAAIVLALTTVFTSMDTSTLTVEAAETSSTEVTTETSTETTSDTSDTGTDTTGDTSSEETTTEVASSEEESTEATATEETTESETETESTTTTVDAASDEIASLDTVSATDRMITEEEKTTVEDAVASLPDTWTVVLGDGTEAEVGVTWECLDDFDNLQTSYVFQASITDSEYELASELTDDDLPLMEIYYEDQVTVTDGDEAETDGTSEEAVTQEATLSEYTLAFEAATEQTTGETTATSEVSVTAVGDSASSTVDSTFWESIAADTDTDYVYQNLTSEQQAMYDALDAAFDSYLYDGASPIVMSGYVTTAPILMTTAAKSSSTTAVQQKYLEEAAEVFQIYYASNPQAFFVTTAWASAVNSTGVYLFITFLPDFYTQTTTTVNGTPSTTVTSQVASGANTIQSNMESILTAIAAEETDYNQILVAHDTLLDYVAYDFTGYTSAAGAQDKWTDYNMMFDQSMASVFYSDAKVTVCAGYSKAFSALMRASGFETLDVTSSVHEWNKIKLNNIWYVVDCTWDDSSSDGSSSGSVTHDYFLVSDETAESDNTSHEWNDYWVGVAPESLYDYPNAPLYSAEELAAFLNNAAGTTVATYTDTTVTLTADISNFAYTMYLEGGTITLDLNGHSIAGTKEKLFVVDGDACEFHLIDSTNSDVSLSASTTAVTYTDNDLYNTTTEAIMQDVLASDSAQYMLTDGSNTAITYTTDETTNTITTTATVYVQQVQTLNIHTVTSGYTADTVLELLLEANSATSLADLGLTEGVDADSSDDEIELYYFVGKSADSITLPTLTWQAEKGSTISYSFGGWYDVSDYTTKLTSLDTTAGTAYDLYADWSYYRIAFHGNGADSGSMAVLGLEAGSSYTLRANAYTRAGYVFAGWATSASGDVILTDGQDVTLESGKLIYDADAYAEDSTTGYITLTSTTLNLYAIWEEADLTVTYDANGGTFTGTSADTLQQAVSYSSVYYIGTWTDATDSTVNASSVTRVGYKFSGWNTRADGKGTTYKQGAKYTNANKTGATLTLYAQWTVVTYGVTYSNTTSTKASSTLKSSYKVTDGTYTLPTLTRTNYEFLGWYASADDAELAIQIALGTTTVEEGEEPEEITSLTADNFTSYLNSSNKIQLYAAMKPYTYQVSYDLNTTDESAEVDLGSYTSSQLYRINTYYTAATATRNGYVLSYWTTNADGTGTKYSAGKTFQNLKVSSGSPTVTLYAQWTKVTYTITYNLNGGSNSSLNPKNFTVTTSETTLYNPTKSYYTFVGWSLKDPSKYTLTEDDYITSINPTELTSYFTNGLADLTGNKLNLYAVWEPYTYTIRYHLNSDTASFTDADEDDLLDDVTYEVTYDYGTSYKYLSAVYNPGYSISNWNTRSDGKGTKYTAGATLKNLSTTDGITIDLYAQWTTATYKITYDLNGGSTNGGNVTSFNKNTSTITLKNALLSGKSTLFDGWVLVTTDSDGNEVETEISTITPSEIIEEVDSYTITLRAKWKTYSVTYNSNTTDTTSWDSTTLTDSGLTIGTKYTFDSTLTRVGYTLSYYTTNANGTGTKYYPGKTYTNLGNTLGTTDVQLYAYWTKNTYTLSYQNMSGATNSTGNVTSYNVSNSDVTLYSAKKTGYTFLGWYSTAADAALAVQIALGNSTADAPTKVTSITSTNVDDYVTVSGSKKIVYLYAAWQPNSYTITYHINNGDTSVSDVTQTYYYGTASTYAASTLFTNAGYSLKNWNTRADGKGTAYTAGKSFSNLTATNGANIDLYATWTATKYTITYKLRGGSSAGGSTTTYYATTNAFTLKNGVKSYATFLGWYASEEEAEAAEDYAKGNVRTNTATAITSISPSELAADGTIGNLTLYAAWDTSSYTVYFDTNGGTFDNGVSANDEEVEVGNTLTMPSNLSRSGYTLTGWNTSADGKGTTYKLNTSYKNLSTVDGTEITLYAMWSYNKYNVTYDLNGVTDDVDYGTLTFSEDTLTLEETIGTKFTLITATELTRTGYKLTWNTKADGTGKSYAAGASVSNLATAGNAITLYAIWTKISYSVSYTLNGGSHKGYATTYNVENGSVTLTTPTRTGYTFLGWYTSSSDVTTAIAAYSDSSITAPTAVTALTSDLIPSSGTKITLYAAWRANTYTITYHSNISGSDTTTAVTYNYNTSYTYGASTLFSNAGYTMTYWTTNSDGTGTKYTAGKTLKNLTATDGANIDVYALWTVATYKITYSLGGGKSLGTNPTSYNVNTASTTLYDASLAYSTFKSWTAKDSSGNTATVDTIDFATLYAKGLSGNLTITANYTMYTYSVVYDFTQDYQGNAISDTTYDADGEAATGDSVTASCGTSYTFLKGITRYGYTLSGWKTATGTTYKVGATFKNLSTTNGATITLYPVWTRNTYKITYSLNGGSSNGGNSTSYNAETSDFTLKDAVRANYQFAGWYTSPDFTSGTQVTSFDVSEMVKTGNVTLYAKWTANTYTVNYTFDDDIDNSTYSVMAASDLTMTCNVNSTYYFSTRVERAGYTLTGWYDASTKKTYTPGATFKNLTTTNGGTITLKAVWTANTYTITYSLNGGKNASTNVSSYNINSGTIELDNPTKSYATFIGWFTTADAASAAVEAALDGDTESYTPVTTISASTLSNVTLYAAWKPYTYTIRYHSNLDSDTYTSVTYRYGTASTYAAASTFTKSGYTLSYWNTLATGKGTKYTPGKSFSNLSKTDGATIDLYAQWSINTYTITYNLNGGKISGSYTTKFNATTADITLPTKVTKSYATFLGWYATNSTSGTKVTSISPTELADTGDIGNITLYALWSEQSYTINFNLNTSAVANDVTVSSAAGLTFTSDSSVYTLSCSNNTSYTLPTAAQVTSEGYTLTGWKVGTKTYKPGATVNNLVTTDGGSITLTAVWSTTKYTITYYLNGGTNGKGNASSYTATTGFPTLTDPTRTYYTFAGWYLDPDFTTAYTASTASYGNLKLYAKWTANDVTVTFMDSDGTTTLGTKTYTADNTYQLPNGYTKDGYTLTGWSLTAGSTKVNYAPGVMVKNLTKNTALTLYAVWTKTTYTVTYVTNGGTLKGSYTKNFTVTNATVTLPTITRTNYEFAGWYTDPDFSEDSYVSGTVDVSSDLKNQVYYAKWTAYTYKVNFDLNLDDEVSVVNYGSISSTSSTTDGFSTTLDTGTAYTLPTLKRAGYTFLGWSKSATATSASYVNSKTYSNLATGVSSSSKKNSVTLYAVWKKPTYSISYTLNGGTKISGSKYPTTYTASTTQIIPGLTKTYYDFTGWYINDATCSIAERFITTTDCLEEKIEELGIYGNVVLYAAWDPIDYTISVDLADSAASFSDTGEALAEAAGWTVSTDSSGVIILTMETDAETSVSLPSAEWFTKSGGYEEVASWVCSNGSSYSPETGVSFLTKTDGDTVTFTADWNLTDSVDISTSATVVSTVRATSNLNDSTSTDLGVEVNVSIPNGVNSSDDKFYLVTVNQSTSAIEYMVDSIDQTDLISYDSATDTWSMADSYTFDLDMVENGQAWSQSYTGATYKVTNGVIASSPSTGSNSDNPYKSFGLKPYMCKFALAVKNSSGVLKLVSNSAYCTNTDELAVNDIYIEGDTVKGIQGSDVISAAGGLSYTENVAESMASTLSGLGVSHIFLNLYMSTVMTSTGDSSYDYNGTTYSFNNLGGYYELAYRCSQYNISVTMQIMLDYSSSTKAMIHSKARSSGHQLYSWENSQQAGVQKIAAAFNYLAERFGTNTGTTGVISNWVLGNEINSYTVYQYKGSMSTSEFFASYAQTYLALYQAVKSVNSGAHLYICLDHCWNTNSYGYTAKYSLDTIASLLDSYSTDEENPVDWDLAFHPYANPLTTTAFWNNSGCTQSVSTSYINMSNINVLTEYVASTYGSDKYIILSEQGYTSTNGQSLQAAALVYSYYIAAANPMIHAFEIRSYYDDSNDGVLKLGLLTSSGSKKEAFYAYKYVNDTSATAVAYMKNKHYWTYIKSSASSWADLSIYNYSTLSSNMSTMFYWDGVDGSGRTTSSSSSSGS